MATYPAAAYRPSPTPAPGGFHKPGGTGKVLKFPWKAGAKPPGKLQGPQKLGTPLKSAPVTKPFPFRPRPRPEGPPFGKRPFKPPVPPNNALMKKLIAKSLAKFVPGLGAVLLVADFYTMWQQFEEWSGWMKQTGVTDITPNCGGGGTRLGNRNIVLCSQTLTFSDSVFQELRMRPFQPGTFDYEYITARWDGPPFNVWRGNNPDAWRAPSPGHPNTQYRPAPKKHKLPRVRQRPLPQWLPEPFPWIVPPLAPQPQPVAPPLGGQPLPNPEIHPSAPPAWPGWSGNFDTSFNPYPWFSPRISGPKAQRGPQPKPKEGKDPPRPGDPPDPRKDLPSKPPKGTKENKNDVPYSMGARIPQLAKWLGRVTEAIDWTQAAWKALPYEVRKKYGPARYVTYTDRLKILYRHWDEVDASNFIQNLVEQDAGDRVRARLSKGASGLSRASGNPFGPTIGPAM